MIKNGKQYAPTLDGIRDDHKARYQWAGKALSRKPPAYVFDAGCGCGYGSYILAKQFGLQVLAWDEDEEAIEFAKAHYSHPLITFHNKSLSSDRLPPKIEAVTAFEVIEHLGRPTALLNKFRNKGLRLFGSVPNQDVNPYNKDVHSYHHRHYTDREIVDLLVNSKFDVKDLSGQRGKLGRNAEVSMLSNVSMTIIFEAVRE